MVARSFEEIMEMEVICISSDDESDSQKENKTDKYVVNSVEANKIIVNEKTETSLSVDEKAEDKNLKRKIWQTEKEKVTIICNNNVEKKRKLNVDEGTSNTINNKLGLSFAHVPELSVIVSNCKAEQSKKEVAEKMLLVVKEKKKVAYITQDVFPLFLSLCFQKCPKQEKTDMGKIIDKLKRRYENMDLTYARSESFVTFLNEKREAIMNENKKLYIYIEEVMNEMKKHITKTSQTNESYDALPSTSYASNVPINNTVESDSDDDDDDSENTNLRTRRKIKQILRAMRKCEVVIKKLEEEEVDFNEENDSNYIKVERYKRRMVELYSKLCELTGEKADAGRAYLRSKHLSVTQIVAVDQEITNFINSAIIRRNRIKKIGAYTNDLIFPNYRDILKCVNRCNDKKNLGLDEGNRKRIAEKAFKELGDHLQRTRQNDYWDTFSLYLENTEDPAIKDKNLAKKLADNRSEGEKRLAAVFEKYVNLQNLRKTRDENNEGTLSEEEEDEDEDEKKENIDGEDKNKYDLFVISEESDYDENMEKTVEENKLSTERSKHLPRVNVISVHHTINKAISNKTTADTLQSVTDKCNTTVKIKRKEHNRNETVSENMLHKPCSSNTIPRNIVNTKTQKDSIPVASTSTCTKDLAEAETINVPKVISDPATKKNAADTVTRITTELVTRRTTQLVTGDTAKLITGDVEETKEHAAEVITDKTELIMGNVTDGEIENMSNDEQPEEQKKPVLRLCSFAKPPTTWEDNQHKTGKNVQQNAPKVASQVKEIVDLTNEGTVKSPQVLTKCAVQLGNKVIPLVKRQTLSIPANKNIINVYNVKNNFLKVNARTGQIIAPVRDITGSTIIRLPSIQTIGRQNQTQTANATRKEVPLKGNATIVRILPSSSIIIPTKSVAQSVQSKQTDVGPSTTK